MFLKILSSSTEGDISDFFDNFTNSISTITFQIPEQVYQAFEVLTKFVGYIMPLRLYTPIITLVLGYWFILVFGASVKFLFNIFKRILQLLPEIFGFFSGG